MGLLSQQLLKPPINPKAGLPGGHGRELGRISHHDRGGRGERPGDHGSRQHFVHITQHTVSRQARAMNRAPTSLTDGIFFRSRPPLVTNAD